MPGAKERRPVRPACRSARINPAADLQFVFAGGRTPNIKREWLEELVLLADTAAGLHVTHEGALRPIEPTA